METLRISLLCAFVLIAAGCGDSNTVSGTVSLNGQPIESGSILFQTPDGTGASFGGVISNGHYKVSEVRPGPRIVKISAKDTSKAGMSREEAMEVARQAAAEGRDSLQALSTELIPSGAEGNDQLVEIEAGAQTLNFAIKTDS